MRRAGALVGNVLSEVASAVKPGVSTGDLNQIALEMILGAGAKAAFLGYPHPARGPAFTGALCISLNDEVVHGVPRKDRVVEEGDIVSLDCGVLLQGFYGDAAVTVAVGKVDAVSEQLLATTRASLEAAVSCCCVGTRLKELSTAVEAVVVGAGFSVVRDFVGHGIGRRLHEDPQVPNYSFSGGSSGYKFREGLVLAIEPMVNVGGPDTEVLADQWTVVTKDRSRSAHFEHSIAITRDGPWVLTTPG